MPNHTPLKCSCLIKVSNPSRNVSLREQHPWKESKEGTRTVKNTLIAPCVFELKKGNNTTVSNVDDVQLSANLNPISLSRDHHPHPFLKLLGVLMLSYVIPFVSFA
jgi:hypothetical protein